MTKAYNILVSYAKALMKLLPNRLTLKSTVLVGLLIKLGLI